jgi:hypothetical protein
MTDMVDDFIISEFRWISPLPELPSPEEVAASFPKTDQYSDVTQEISWLFDHYVYQEAKNPTEDPSRSKNSYFQIDGIISDDEFLLFETATDILQDVLHIKETSRWHDFYYETLISILIFISDYHEEVVIQLSVDETAFIPIHKEMPDYLREELVTLIEFCYSYASAHEKVVLHYILQEIQKTWKQDQSLSFRDHISLESYSLSDDEEFREFNRRRAPQYIFEIENFNGTVVDYVDSGSGDHPTLVVALDMHKNRQLSQSNLYDTALLRHFDPVVGQEGYEYSEVSDVPANIPNLRKEYQEINQMIYETLLDIIKLTSLLKKIIDGEEKQALYDQIERTHAHVEELALQAYKNARAIELLAAQQDLSPIFFEREEVFKTQMWLLEQAGGQMLTFSHGARLLYPQMDVQGYEYFGHSDYRYYLEDSFLPEPDQTLLDRYNTILRSRSGIDNVLAMMEKKEVDLGVMIMGADHFESLKAYIQERGDVNAIFVMPLPYDGPMPRE